jgi:sugar lactone lactonase YvrE
VRHQPGEHATARYFAAGLLLAATFVAGRVEGQAVTTLAGYGTQGSADGTGSTATFFYPAGVAVDASGNVLVADSYNTMIRKITPAGVVTTLAGSVTAGSIDGTGTAASFEGPTGVAVDASGNVLVADSYNNKIRKITPGGVVTTLAGSGLVGSDDGTGTAATFLRPVGVAVDSSGNVYGADLNNNKIRKVTSAGVVTTLAGSGGTGSTDGPGTVATFNYPTGIAVDSSGNVYVGDSASNKIRKVTSAGVVTTLAGSGGNGSADGTAAAATFNYPTGVAVDSSGNVYVGDSANNKIRKITVSTGPCVPDAFTACLIGGRYKVTSHWQNQYAGGEVRTLSAAKLTDATAAFWLYDADTYEYLIRINTATDNGFAWIAIPTFTDVEFWIAVTDTVRGLYYEYHSPPGNKTLIYDPYFFVYP